MPHRLSACIAFAVVLAACGGQVTPGAAHHDCNVKNPHECCGSGCGQDFGPATCGPTGWACTVGEPGACGGLCIPVPSLDGGDAETDAPTTGDDTADDETDGSADDGEGTGGCGTDYTAQCCGFGPPHNGMSCVVDYGASVCGASGWTCPDGGNPGPACNMICMDFPDAGDGG